MRAELKRAGSDLDNLAMLYRSVSVDNMLDLTNPAVRRQLGIDLTDLTGDDYLITQALGDWARARGFDGIIAPSARLDGATTVMTFGGF